MLATFLILISFLIYIYLRSFLVIRRRNNYCIKDWMEMTKAERKKIDYRDKENTLKRKKALLKSIRKEYKNMKKLK